MTEVTIETTCDECETEFDDSNNTRECNVCDDQVCEGCEDEHAKKHCFEDSEKLGRRKKR